MSIESSREQASTRATACSSRTGARIPCLAAAVLLAALGFSTLCAAADGIKFESRRVAMKDGVMLNVCLARPSSLKPGARLPALLTTDPYAKPCGEFGRKWYADYVRGGYVVAYAEVRGSGGSDGVFQPREYSEAELDDAVTMIEWLARQPWSTGKVGMFGTSWSGFNSMLVAARKPPALKAIVPHMATEDIYHEDTHYANGIFRIDDYNVFADLVPIATPPDRDPFDETTLRQRFDQAPWSLTYLKQQRDGDFWMRSVRRDLSPTAGDVPTLMIGAWHDGYRQAVLRALEHSRAPVKAIIGPWDHSSNFPGPTADLGRVTLRWWDYWLKGIKNGVLDEPQVYAYMRRSYRPLITRAAIPGEWRAIQRWPAAGNAEQSWHLTARHGLERSAGAAAEHQLRYIPSAGREAGLGWADIPPDQRRPDSESLVYESDPLSSELNVLGAPRLSLRAAASAPHANWIVKLSDVAPDGTTTLVTGGAINATHRNSSVNPEALEPEKLYDLTVTLFFTSWIFEPGHRIRVAVSNAQWPMFWPTPYPMMTRLQVGDGGASFTLPVIPAAGASAAQATAAALGSRNLSHEEAEAAVGTKEYSWNGPARSESKRDDIKGTTTVTRGFQWESPDGEDVVVEYALDDGDPAHARFTGHAFLKQTWQGQQVEWRGTTEIASDATAFNYRHLRQLLRDGKVVREREWKERVPREFQ
jgi:putative CocE/NonD family hydrolase